MNNLPPMPHRPFDSPATLCWSRTMARVADTLQTRALHPADTLVLLPSVQLLAQAGQAWSAHSAQGTAQALFMPRFETPQTWAARLGPMPCAALGPVAPAEESGGNNISGDMALDRLHAAALLAQAGLADQQAVLLAPLLEAAWSLMALAAAQHPAQRLAWGAARAAALNSASGVAWGNPVLAYEEAVARIALAWVASSSYATDVLFDTPVQHVVVLQGLQPDALTQALTQQWGERVTVLPLYSPGTAPSLLPIPLALGDTEFGGASGGMRGKAQNEAGAAPPARLCNAAARPSARSQAGVFRCEGYRLHCAQDAEDEAERAAACVLRHLGAGRSPVALVAQDRQLTRRVAAMLVTRGVGLRDETGWKLSTTRAAANLLGLLRAVPEHASSDALLAWLKSAPAFAAAQVSALETVLRKNGIRAWRDLPDFSADFAAGPAAADAAPVQPLVLQVAQLQAPLRQPRSVWQWLQDLRSVLQAAGQWEALASDSAGQALLAALRLPEGAASELHGAPSMTLAEFTQWVQQVLESGSFLPPQPQHAQVIILPLAQLLGRPVAAVVLPGCDEVQLPASPEPPGPWTPAQRALLGLPAREALALARQQAWHYALKQPQLDVLWRSSEAGEHLAPSPWVQRLLLDRGLDGPLAADPRQLRPLVAQPTARPQPVGQTLPVTRLSASAYEDLRRCPYRFFALRQLQLQAPPELDSAVGKRDFGNWLHSLLRYFHEMLKADPTHDLSARIAMINIAAERATQTLQLTHSEFLPFAAAWPPVRQGYLAWLAQHEAGGARFEAAEAWREMPLGELTLLGKLDRIDRQADGTALVIDYKTEPRSSTANRIKAGPEDTQLAFYAALLADDELQAAYVNVAEKEGSQSYMQPDIVHLRDGLIDSLLHDMRAIALGAALPALGEGKACDYCDARGLCRKDFW